VEKNLIRKVFPSLLQYRGSAVTVQKPDTPSQPRHQASSYAL